MTRLEHLKRQRERHGLLARERLPHMSWFVRSFLARSYIHLPPGLFLSLRRTGTERIYSAPGSMNLPLTHLLDF
jgi:hypothetical protein